MAKNEIDIKSSTIDKGVEFAKEFLSKLIMPTVEETGLLIADNIKFFRFKNQVRILLKAKEYVETRKLNTSEIPIKILVPLLENASLEEDEELQDKWAKMLTNMVDSDLNLQNQIFPYLLSQISISEYDEIKKLLKKEDEYYLKNKKYWELKKDDQFSFNQMTKDIRKEIDKIEQNGFSVELEAFEESNLERLGLIRKLPPNVIIKEFRTGSVDHYEEQREQWHQLEAEYDSSGNGYRITELGIKFLNICELYPA